MLETATILEAIVPVLLYAALGALARAVGILPVEAERGLMRLIVSALYPAFIIHIILTSERMGDPAELWQAPVLGFGCITGGMALAWALGRVLGLREAARRTFACCCGIFNYGYLAIPVCLAIFPVESGTVGMLLVFNVGVDLAMWSVGLLLLTGELRKASLRRIINGPLIALAIALPVKMSGLAGEVPVLLGTTVAGIGGCAIPLAVMLIGATFFDLARSMRWLGGIKVAVGGITARLGLIPVLMLAIAWLLPIDQTLRNVIVVQAAMPCGLFPIMLAKHYGADTEVAARVVVLTTLTGLITIPLWLKAGYAWIGP